MPSTHSVGGNSFPPLVQVQSNTTGANQEPLTAPSQPNSGHPHPNLLQHPPGASNQARLLQAALNARRGMSISGASWEKVNTAQDPEVIHRIADHIDNYGLGHVVWGSKPVFYLEGSDEDGIWQDMKWLVNSEPLKEDFQLVEVTNNCQKPAEKHTGYLVNKGSLLKVIEEHKDFFASKFEVSDLSSAKSIRDELVIPHLKKLSSEALSGEHEFLAITLGYGRSNATALSRSKDAIENTTQLSEQFEQWRASRAQEKDAFYPIPKFPPFTMFPSEESQRLVNGYARDSDEMHTAITALLEQHADLVASDDDVDVADAKLIVAALLTSLKTS